MPIKNHSRYEPGSPEDGAYKLLIECDVEVDSVFGIEPVREGMNAITFVAHGRALTAFATDDAVVRVADGWDVPPPDTEVGHGKR